MSSFLSPTARFNENFTYTKITCIARGTNCHQFARRSPLCRRRTIQFGTGILFAKAGLETKKREITEMSRRCTSLVISEFDNRSLHIAFEFSCLGIKIKCETYFVTNFRIFNNLYFPGFRILVLAEGNVEICNDVASILTNNESVAAPCGFSIWVTTPTSLVKFT